MLVILKDSLLTTVIVAMEKLLFGREYVIREKLLVQAVLTSRHRPVEITDLSGNVLFTIQATEKPLRTFSQKML